MLGGFEPDMVTASAKALLSTQRTPASVHEVAEELPASGGLIAAQALCFCHTAMPTSLRLAESLHNLLIQPPYTKSDKVKTP